MRIAYLLADHGIPVFGEKGASVHVRDFATALCQQGHDVTLFCAKHGNPDRDTPYHLHKIPSEPILPFAQTDTAGADNNRRIKEERYLRAADTILETLLETHRQQPFDAIYERYSLWSAAGVRAARLLGIPVIMEVNSPLLLEQSRYRELALADTAARIEQEVFAQANGIIAVSQEVADYTVSQGAARERVHVLPNGVDPLRFHPAVTPAAVERSGGRFLIAFSGSLKAWHGVDILLEAFRELVKRFAGMHLLVIGDGPMREWISGYVAGANLASNVTLTGWVGHDDIPGLLARADVAVAPYPEIDGFYFSPLKLFEYMALGKPVIASRIGQITSVLRHQENGLMVAPGKIAELTDALEHLYLHRELREQLGKQALADSSAYTWKQNASHVSALYAQLSGMEVAA